MMNGRKNHKLTKISKIKGDDYMSKNEQINKKALTTIVIVYGTILGMLIGSLAFICEENRELKRQLKDVQSTVKMLDEELQQVYRVE